MGIPLLNDIVLILGLSVVVIFVCHRLKVPAIVGFLVTGIIAGPYGLGLIKAVNEVEILAEVGVVALLFTIGIEFSLEKLLRIRKTVLVGGSIQVLLTILVTFLVVNRLGKPVGESIFTGFLISLSSTAIVLKLLQERAEIDSPYGRTDLGILIFQDVIIVPMILLTPLLAGAANGSGEFFFILTAKGIAIVGFVIVSAKWIVPHLLYQIARTRSQELFMVCIIVICLSIAWMTSSAGLSLALGAFMAGLIISESEYSHHALGSILPFRDVFTSFFFISVGMLLDVSYLFERPATIVFIAVGVLVLKSCIAGLAAFLLGLPLRTAILAGIALSQVGEFSFILSETGMEHGFLTGVAHQMFLACSVLTMAATPFVIVLSPRLAELILRLPLPERVISGFSPVAEIEAKRKKDHLIIVGYGVNGTNVARAAKFAGISYTIIEMNPETVRSEQAKGEPIFFGDATREAVLQHADIKDARIIAVAINDPASTRRITEVTRRLNPKVHLIVRTRYLQEMKSLYELGANEVIPEEFETSVEIFARVLAKYLIPRNEIEKFVTEVRSGGYEMFRCLSRDTTPAISDLNLYMPDVEIDTVRISEKSCLAGKSLAEMDLRRKFGVTVLAIRRDQEILANPKADMPLFAKDVLYIIGSPDKLSEAASLFDNF
jgi:CPA2 family monovalent cation:H+ antiporter-2